MITMAKFDLERFDPQPDPELICNICQSVFCEPTETPCRHVFCKACISTWLNNQRTCPTCRKRTTRISLQPVLPIIQNMINKLTVKCEHVDEGCQAIVLVELFDNHMKECPCEMVTCENIPCIKKMLRKDIEVHEKKCKHRLIQCPDDCQLEISKASLKNHNCLQELKNKVSELQEGLKQANNEKSELKKQIVQLEKNVKDVQQRRRQRISFSDQSDDSWRDNWTDDSSLSQFTLDQSQVENPQNLSDNLWSWNVSFPSRITSPRSRRTSVQRASNSNDLLPVVYDESSVPSAAVSSLGISAGSETMPAAGNSHIGTGENNMLGISSIITLLQQLLNQSPSGIEENQTSPTTQSTFITQSETESNAFIETLEENAPVVQEIVPLSNVNTDKLFIRESEAKAPDLDESSDFSSSNSSDESSEESIQNLGLESISIHSSTGNESEEGQILSDDAINPKRKKNISINSTNLKTNKHIFDDKLNELSSKGLKFFKKEGAVSIDSKLNKKTMSKFSLGINKSAEWLSKSNRCKPDMELINKKGSFKKIYKLKRKTSQVEVCDNSLPGTSGINDQNLRGQEENVAINSKIKKFKSAKFQLKLSGVIPTDHSLAKKSRTDSLQISNECISQSNAKLKKKNTKVGNKNRNSSSFSSQLEPINGILATGISNNLMKNEIKNNENLQSKREPLSEADRKSCPRRASSSYINFNQATHIANDSSCVMNYLSSDETYNPDYLSDITSSEDNMSESDYEILVPKSTSQLLQEYLSDDSDESWHPW